MKTHGFVGGRTENVAPGYYELDLSTYLERRGGRCAYCDDPAVSCLVTDHGTPLCGEHVRAWHRLLAGLEQS